ERRVKWGRLARSAMRGDQEAGVRSSVAAGARGARAGPWKRATEHRRPRAAVGGTGRRVRMGAEVWTGAAKRPGGAGRRAGGGGGGGGGGEGGGRRWEVGCRMWGGAGEVLAAEVGGGGIGVEAVDAFVGGALKEGGEGKRRRDRRRGRGGSPLRPRGRGHLP